MTPQEFKAWFDGFNEGVDDVPTEKQWKKIKERVGQIDNTVTTWPVYVDRYRPYWRDYAVYNTRDVRTVGVGVLSGSGMQLSNANHAVQMSVTAASPFDSLKAMNDLGRADIDECV